jgi:GNAT superfamily N-acetyltransferase
MSNADDNKAFTPFIGTLPETDFSHWLFWETMFGESGEPGYFKKTSSMTNQTLFGHTSPVEVFYTTLRGEDGSLLCVHCQYYDENGIRKPYFMMVHPDSRGKGIATQMALHLEEEFIKTQAHRYGLTQAEFEAMPRHERAALVIPDMYDGVTTNNAGAGFGNKLVEKFFTNESNPE